MMSGVSRLVQSGLRQLWAASPFAVSRHSKAREEAERAREQAMAAYYQVYLRQAATLQQLADARPYLKPAVLVEVSQLDAESGGVATQAALQASLPYVETLRETGKAPSWSRMHRMEERLGRWFIRHVHELEEEAGESAEGLVSKEVVSAHQHPPAPISIPAAQPADQDAPHQRPSFEEMQRLTHFCTDVQAVAVLISGYPFLLDKRPPAPWQTELAETIRVIFECHGGPVRASLDAPDE